ncbi:MAG TPA: VOC family protein [Candidatus Acidoferrales bacterium]|nr:VOC family protein [Candidatus Acidoferrales bacterium]
MTSKRETETYTIERLDHVVLWVSDIDKSIAFYQALGFIVDLNSYSGHVNGALPFVAVKVGGRSNIDLRPAPKDWKRVEREKGNMQHINVTVEGIDDIQTLVAAIAQHGIQPAFPPDTVGGTWRVEYYDPDNNRIEMALTKILEVPKK